MKQYIKAAAALLMLASPLITFAHPGHDHAEGDQGFTIIHYFTSPVHMITSVAVIAAVIGIVRAIRNHDQRA
ncbi:MAG: hypothetical protein WBP58_17375 [Chitinophagaceae bacterium]